MDALVQQALQGTTRQPAVTLPLPPPLDQLVAGLPNPQDDMRLLLAAGAAAVYRQAGSPLAETPPLPDAAAPESTPVCPPAVARLIERVLAGEHSALLPETLALLRRSGMRLPPELLPAALTIRASTSRPALATVLGERGRWLARGNADWRWAAEALPGTTDGAALEALWQEGPPGQRLEAFRRARAHHPATARDWLDATWRNERAEFRLELLKALKTGLAAEDEPALEAALEDRAGGVRDEAARLLSRLPTSSYLHRMAERADACLARRPTATPPGPIDRLLRVVGGAARSSFRLQVLLPNHFGADWRRDGLEPKPPTGMGERGWWLDQLLSRVRLRHWEDRFETGPAEMIAALREEEWEGAVLTAWTRAALAQGAATWAAALWDRWLEEDRRAASVAKAPFISSLLASMTPEDAERRVEGAWRDASAAAVLPLAQLLEHLPRPWSEQFGRRYLQHLRLAAAVVPTGANDQPSFWPGTTGSAALGLPPSCFADALRPVTLPDADTWQLHHWRQHLDRFAEIVDIRRQLCEGLPCSQ